MEKIYALLIITMIILTACQRTPEDEIVIQKEAVSIMASNNSETRNTQKNDWLTDLRANNCIAETVPGDRDNLTISINCEISLPEENEFAIYQVFPSEYSQETAEKAVETLIGNEFKVLTQKWTKSQLEELLIKVKADHVGGNENQFNQDEYDAAVRDLELRIARAPEVPLEEGPSEHVAAFGKSGMLYISKELNNGKTATLKIENNDEGYLSRLVYRGTDGISFSARDIKPEDVNIEKTKEAAVNEAEEIIAKLGLANMEVSATSMGVEIARESETDTFGKQCYLVYFTRVLGGVQVTYDFRDGKATKNPEVYRRPWAYENIIVGVDDDGIAELNWNGYISGENIYPVQSEVKLMDFARIKEIMLQNINIQFAYLLNEEPCSEITCEISEIKLGLMRIKSGENINDFYYVPVWDFFGNIKVVSNDEKGQRNTVNHYEASSVSSILTVNAIDGSIIDRSLGY